MEGFQHPLHSLTYDQVHAKQKKSKKENGEDDHQRGGLHIVHRRPGDQLHLHAHFVEELLIVPDGFGKYGWRVTENDVIGGSAPLAFGAGYSSYATIPFRFGAAASLIAKFDPEKMFEDSDERAMLAVSEEVNRWLDTFRPKRDTPPGS